MKTTSPIRANLKEITARREAGETLTAIAETYGVSRERIRQILIEEYGTTWETSASSSRAGEKEKLLEEWRDELLKQAESGVVLTRSTVVGKSPVRGVKTVEDVLGEYAWVVAFPQVRKDNYSDEEICASMKRVWEKTIAPAPMSRSMYDSHRSRRDVSGARITQRFSSWSEACVRAGVPSCDARRSAYTSLDPDVAVEWVVVFLTEALAAGGELSAARYDEWARDNGAPSMGGIRLALGTWNTARLAATPTALRWQRKGDGKPYPRPGTSGVSAHQKTEIARWRIYQSEHPDLSMRELADALDVPESTLRYHLEP